MSQRDVTNWEVRTGSVSQLEMIARMGKESIGDAHPETKALARRLAFNPDILQVFGRRYSDDRFQLCGYWLLYPLTDGAGTAIIERQIRSGKELGPEELLADFDAAKHLYVGMLLGGPDSDARSHAKTFLGEELARRIAAGRVEAIYGRPASRSGLRLLQDHGFAPIAEEREIWSVSDERLLRHIGSKVGDAS